MNPLRTKQTTDAFHKTPSCAGHGRLAAGASVMLECRKHRSILMHVAAYRNSHIVAAVFALKRITPNTHQAAG